MSPPPDKLKLLLDSLKAEDTCAVWCDGVCLDRAVLIKALEDSRKLPGVTELLAKALDRGAALRLELDAVKRRVVPHGGVHSPEFTAAFERCAP